MTKNAVFKDANVIKRLAERLSRIPEVSKFDNETNREAWALSHSFADLEESCRKLIEEHFPKLVKKDLTNSEIYDLLLEIGEDLRHILYHIRDPRFYQYLSSETAPDNTPKR